MSDAAAWLAACRPKTLTAAAVPVVVGTAIAHAHAVHAWGPAAAALLAAILLQVGANLANDYWDHLQGADTPDRLGPPRAVAQGLLPPLHVRNAAFLAFAAAVAVGLYLVAVAGWPVILIGTSGIAAGLLYTAGPKPLGYLGLGDLLVFGFFGVVAVAGTYWVQALTIHPEAVAAGVPLGALATAILVVNNLRDLPTDRAAGKHTLAVRIGPIATRAQYVLLLSLAYAAASLLALADGTLHWGRLLPLLSLPWALHLTRRILTTTQAEPLNQLLESTARLLALYGLLLAAGWLL